MKQYKIIIFLTTLILLFNTHSFSAQEQENDMNEKMQTEIAENQGGNLNAEDNNNDEMVYQCQMDFEVLSNVPGRCSKCDLNLKLYTLEEAINNLNEHGHKKPALVLKMLNMGNEENTETEENADTTGQNVKIASIDFTEIDHNQDDIVFQCSMHLEQVEDEEEKCPVCRSVFKEYTFEEAEANLHAKAIKKAEENQEAEANL